MNISGLPISHIGGRESLLLLFLLVLTSTGCNVCSEDLKEEVKSPDDKYIAVAYKRNCGATTSTQFHVNLRHSWGWFSHKPEGSIQDGQVFLTETGTIKITWRDSNNLYIDCTYCNDGDYSKTCLRSWEDVSVTCKISPSEPQK